MESFSITTTDAITLSLIKNNPAVVSCCVLCLPMMPATKESYIPLLQALEKTDCLAWAIDFRGHGESTNGGTLDYRQFEDIDHQKYRIDAYEALMQLSEEGDVTAIIGASIGANIALELQADFEVPKTVLLSPGLDYWGIETIPPAKTLTKEQSCYIITSQEVRQSGKHMKGEAQEIFNSLKTTDKKIDIYPGTEHGTDIIKDSPERMKKIVEFLI
jgi:pimeloyl-ACP methyl ester carboxylesterase